MNYITVRLTEDQLFILNGLLQEDIDRLDTKQGIYEAPIAFRKRIQTTLAKAKS